MRRIIDIFFLDNKEVGIFKKEKRDIEIRMNEVFWLVLLLRILDLEKSREMIK